MGNNVFSEKLYEHGELFIEFPNLTQDIGETVQGTVHLNLRQPYTGRCLELKILGMENTQWVKRTDNGNEKRVTTYKGEHKMLEHSEEIYYFD